MYGLDKIMANFFLHLVLTVFIIFVFRARFTNINILTAIKKALSNLVRVKSEKGILAVVFRILVAFNLLGNIPFTNVPTMFYGFTFTLRLTVWLRLIVSNVIRQYYQFVRHLLPFGTPGPLMLLLPLIEILSQLLRPLTLAVRLRTNLCAGHILVFIFSYFFNLLPRRTFMGITLIIVGLQLLELAISVLQAYIFVALLRMYFTEREELIE